MNWNKSIKSVEDGSGESQQPGEMFRPETEQSSVGQTAGQTWPPQLSSDQSKHLLRTLVSLWWCEETWD